MNVQVKYWKDDISAYGGKDYTFKTELPLVPYQKVLVPAVDGSKKKAIVTRVAVSDSEIDPEWIDRLKEITELDKGDSET